MARITRLTERDLTRLVKRVIREREMDEDFFGNTFSKFKSAVNASKEFFKNEVFSDLTDKELSQILRKAENVNIEKIINKLEDEESISESYLNENLISKVKNFVSNLGIYVGGLASAAGLISIAGEVSGWSQSKFFTKINEINEQYMGLGRGNATMALLVMVLGIILACYSYSKRESNRERSES
jgi:hypothetical protein